MAQLGVNSQGLRGISLGVSVNNKHPVAQQDQAVRDAKSRSRFALAAFIVNKGKNFHEVVGKSAVNVDDLLVEILHIIKKIFASNLPL